MFQGNAAAKVKRALCARFWHRLAVIKWRIYGDVRPTVRTRDCGSRDKGSIPLRHPICPRGGTGRRKGLKIPR